MSVSVCWSISCIVLNSCVVCNGPFCFLCKPSIVMSLFVSLFLVLFILFLMSVSIWFSVFFVIFYLIYAKPWSCVCFVFSQVYV